MRNDGWRTDGQMDDKWTFTLQGRCDGVRWPEVPADPGADPGAVQGASTLMGPEGAASLETQVRLMSQCHNGESIDTTVYKYWATNYTLKADTAASEAGNSFVFTHWLWSPSRSFSHHLTSSGFGFSISHVILLYGHVTHHEGAVPRAGGERHAQPHLVFPLRHIVQRDLPWGDRERTLTSGTTSGSTSSHLFSWIFNFKKRDAQTGLTQLEAAAIGRVPTVQRTPEDITSLLGPCGLQGCAH